MHGGALPYQSVLAHPLQPVRASARSVENNRRARYGPQWTHSTMTPPLRLAFGTLQMHVDPALSTHELHFRKSSRDDLLVHVL
jgi:hypothetical protein